MIFAGSGSSSRSAMLPRRQIVLHRTMDKCSIIRRPPASGWSASVSWPAAQQLSRPLDRNSRMLRQQDLKSMLDRLESMARSGAKDAARELLQQLEQMMENLQMATPDMNGDDLGDMMQELDELGDMIHEQQDLRDRTFRQGQDQRRRGAERGPQGRQGQKGHQGQQGQQGQQGDSFGDLRRASRPCATASTNCSKSSRTAVSARTSKVSRASRVKAKAI